MYFCQIVVLDCKVLDMVFRNKQDKYHSDKTRWMTKENKILGT